MIEVADHPAAIALVIAGAMAGLLLALARRRFFHGQPFFIAAIVGIVWWLVAAAAELTATTAAGKLAWAQAAWPGIALVPVAWAAFLLDLSFARHGHRRPLRWVAVLALPVLIAGAALSNGEHGLFYGPGTRLSTDGDTSANIYDHGPLFFASAGVLYIVLLLTLGLLLRAALRTGPAHRGLFRALLAVTLLPMAGNLGYLLADVTLFGFDPTPFLFALVFLLLGGALTLGRSMDLEDTARDVLFESAEDGMIVLEAGGRVVGVNAAARRLSGAIPLADRVAPDDDPVQDFARQMIESGTPPEPRVVRLDDAAFEMRAIPIPPPLGRRGPAGWVLSLRDATRLVTLSDALTAERDRLETVMENSGIGFLMIGVTGEILYANSEAARITGRAQQDMEALNYDDPTWRNMTLGGTPMASVDLPVAKVIQTGEPVLKERHAMLRRDGSRRVLSVSAVPLPSASGTQVVASVTDVTEEARATEALRAARDRAEAASRAKSRFLAMMSHEIRTPLNGVLGMAELLEDRATDAESRRMAGVIRESGDALMAMLNDVLDIAQLEEGPVALQNRPFRPSDLADTLDAGFAAQAEEKGLVWEIYASSGARTSRRGDPDRIAQVARIAVGNAVKFTDTGRVLVTISGEAGRPVVIEVSDTGPGMPPDRIEALRQPFAQAENDATRAHGGTGLGLAIADGLVAAMGGDLAIHSSPGLGTRVRISLPLAEA